MGSPCPSPRASCVEAGLHRALFTAPRTHKDQSEHHGVQHQKEGKTEGAKEVRQEGGGAEKQGEAEERSTYMVPQACLKELEKGLLSSKATPCLDRSPYQCTPDRAGPSFRYRLQPREHRTVLHARYQFLFNEQAGKEAKKSHRQTSRGHVRLGLMLRGQRMDWGLIRFPRKAKSESS